MFYDQGWVELQVEIVGGLDGFGYLFEYCVDVLLDGFGIGVLVDFV